jgi:hypothetical protein
MISSKSTRSTFNEQQATAEVSRSHSLVFHGSEIHVLVMLGESRRHYATEVVPDGEALLCFLSPIDAHIEGTLRTRRGRVCVTK